MSSPVRVAVIGAGSIAKVAQLPSLAVATAAGRVKVTGVVTKDVANAERTALQFEGCRAFGSLHELLSKDPPEAAFVLTPKETHAEIAASLLEAEIDVFCEKPLATTLTDARRLVELAEKRKRLLMVGFNRRYAPVYVKAKEVFAEQAPLVCIAQKNRPQTEYRATLENAIHMVDLLRWYCGEAAEINAASQYLDPYYETTTLAQLRFVNGALGVLVAHRQAGQWTERLELNGGGRTVMVDAPDSVRVICGDSETVVNMTPLAMGWAEVRDKMGFQGEVDHFVECVRTRETPRTSGADALLTHELMDNILRRAGLPPM